MGTVWRVKNTLMTDAEIVSFLKAAGFVGPVARAWTRTVQSSGPNGNRNIRVESAKNLGGC